MASTNDPEARKRRAAERKRLHRERQRAGIRFVLPIPVYEDALDALVQRGEMSEDEAEDRRKATAVLEDLLNHWALSKR